MFKKVVSVVMALVIMVGVVPISALAKDDTEPIVRDSMSVEGQNSLGNVFSKAIEESKEVTEGTNNCHINDISISEQTAEVELVCENDCQVVVTLCDEQTNEVVATGSQLISQGESSAVVPFYEEIPENYVVKAAIVDDEFNPISPEYVDVDNTAWHEEFEELKTSDFDKDLVINLDDDINTNFAVLKEDVVVVNADDEETQIINNDTQVTVESESKEFAALSTGDIFCYNKDDPDNLVLGRVVEKHKTDKKTTLISEEVEMSDVFDIVKVFYDETGCDLEAEANSVIHSDNEKKAQTRGIFEGDFDTYVSKKQSVSLGSKGIVGLSGTLTFQTGLYLKIEWNAWKFYAFAIVKLTPLVSFQLSLTAKTNIKPKQIAAFDIPVGPTGLTVRIKLNFIFEASVSLSLTGSISQTKGFSWSTVSGSRNLSTDPVVTGDFKIEGKIKVGVEIVPEITALTVIGVGFKGELALQATASTSWSASSDGKKHDCGACIAGDISFVTSLKFTIEIDLKIWNKDWEIKLTGEIKIKITDWYWSITYGEFNFGKCPHFSYKTTVKVVDENGRPIAGASVDGVKTNSSGEAVKYYSVGKHKLTVKALGYQTRRPNISISDHKLTVKVGMVKGSSSDVVDYDDDSYSDYDRYIATTKYSRYHGGTYVAPLTYTEPEEGVVLSTRLASQRRSDVAWVQRELKNLGYNITTDGYYGNLTASVVRQFQQDYSLPVTGTVNANVVAVIKKPIKPVTEPKLRLTTNPDIASGGIVSVSWDGVANASDYNVYVYNSADQLVASAVGTKATNASFVLYEVGEYTVKAVSGNDRFTSSTAALNQKIRVHNPSLVTFVDWDGTVLSKQFVEYGKSATTPASPERDGYTFSKWDKAYTNITDQELTVTAQYTRNKYTVKFMNVSVNGSEKVLKSDSCYFGESAQAPDAEMLSIPQGYNFIGWDKDFSNITESITVKPVLEWANDDLPILIESYDAVKDQGYGYDVSLTVRNFDKQRTTGRVVVALKTESGRFITMTESSAFTLAKSNSSSGVFNRETLNIFVPCEENAAYIDIFVVGNYSSLIPISEVKRLSTGETTENEGVQHTAITGTVDTALAGKQAILFIYKIDEAADYTNEYVGQTVIGTDGSYSFDYRLREEPTPETGDYTVALGIEGADGAIFLDTIEAPRRTFTVTIKDYDGEILDTQTVFEGDSAILPTTNPEREGYRFAGWDYSNSSIHEDLTITAIYVPKTYTVVFIDWTNERFDMKTYQHGEAIDSRDLSLNSLVDYDAIGWEGVTEGMRVTQNMVITAKYEKKQFTVKFYDYDGNVVDEQTVAYGDDAKAPVFESDATHIFYGWDAEDLMFVTNSVEVHPFFSYTESTETPSASINTGIYNDSVTVSLTCATEDSEIYYSLNGGNYVLYTAPVTISQTSVLIAYASSFGRNDSGTLTEHYAVNSVGDEANWKVPVHVVIDGESAGTYLVSNGSRLNTSSLPVSKTGYTVEGFYYDAGFNRLATNELVNTETTVYAKLAADTFTVTFKDIDGNTLDTQTVAYLEAAEAPEVLASIENLIFVGWDTDDYLCVTEDVTVSAVYIDEAEFVGITLNRDSYNMMEGYSYTLTAKTTGSGITEVFWESSDESVATVDSNGKVTAVNDGTVIITATAIGETTASASCYLTVEANPAHSITLKQWSTYVITQGYICGISPSNNTVENIVSQIQAANIKVFDGENEISGTDVVKTGCTVSYYDEDGDEIDTMVLVVTGDVDGNGIVNNRDTSHIMRHIIGKENLEVCFLLAADTNADGNVNNKDASLIARVVAQKESL